MEKSKMQAFMKRSLTALVLLPIVLGAIYYGYPWVQMLILVFGAMLCWEWAHMVPNRKPEVYGILYTIVFASAVLLDSPLAVGLMVLGGTAVAIYQARGELRRNLLVLGVPYIAVGLGSVAWIYQVLGAEIAFWFLLVVWFVDIGGYIVGCTLKGPKLAPKVSPNKTWSGLIGGMLFSVIASTAFCYAFGVMDGVYFYGILAAMFALIAQIGDLVESHIKRSLGIKDSSNLIPGHGGVFDRVDGLIFAAPFFYFIFRYFLWIM